jgi:hypothetical protein
MAIEDVPENPFSIVPAGGRCITKPLNSWNNSKSVTYVFSCHGHSPFHVNG